MSLAREREQDGPVARALAGARSQFDVIADGGLVFSKEREHRFPEYDEIAAKL